MAILEAHEVSVSFGGHRALDLASVEAPGGEITGLIGPNGAGKTTMFNAITGMVPTNSGRIVVDGKDVTSTSLHRRARCGLARTFQQLELFTMLTVRENIRVAADVRKRWARDKGDMRALTEEIIERVGLASVADERVTALSTGQGRLVELGRALACKPRVLLLDEPASGQDDNETARFGRLLGEVAATGTAVLLVEHDMALVMDVCDRVHVLDLGRILAVGSPAEVQQNPLVLDAYLGAGSQSTT
ncbi:MAG: ABC transporter ATP-binding protein [Microthrixaceae bacterium]